MKAVAARTGAAVAVGMGLAACGDGPNALAPKGDGAREIAGLWWLLFGLGTAVFVLVAAVLVRAVVASRPRAAGDVDGEVGDRAGYPLVVAGGVVLPLVVLVPLSLVVMRTTSRVAFQAGATHLAVEVVAHQYWWEVRYPESGAVTANELHIPVGRPVDLTLRSQDVVHSFWVPELAGKIDNIPGETTNLNLVARHAGVYRGVCAEYCGLDHTKMQFLVVAQPEAEFEQWLASEAAGRAPPQGALAQRGERVFNDSGCGACHTVRGTAAAGVLGPDLTHFGRRQTIGAATVANNRGNLGGWVANPRSLKAGAKMPATPLDGDELQAVIAYLEGLR